jgi:hypothetical protein
MRLRSSKSLRRYLRIEVKGQFAQTWEENLCQEISNNFVTDMELKENILFQVLLNKMEL